jgi:tetratricopeptide (TPR) repeat protein
MIHIRILLLLFILSPLVSASAIEVETGDVAPDFTLSTLDGKTFSLNGSRDNVVVMMYWRVDQNRSLKALEQMKIIDNSYADKGVTVISIVADTADHEKVNSTLKEKAVQFPALIDIDRRVYGDYGIRVYPSTVIIDREGKVFHTIPGFAVTFRMRLDGYIRHALGEIDDDQLQDVISPKRRSLAGKETLTAERKYNLAVLFAESRLIDQAIEAAKGSLAASPDVAKVHILLGFLYLDQQENEKAEEEFQKALELEPGSHDAQAGLGGVMIEKGEIESAIEILKEAARTNPKPQFAYYELGRAYERSGEKDRAIEMYKKAVDKIINKNIPPSSVTPCK